MRRFFHEDWRKAYREKSRTQEQLRDDLVVAFDRIEVLKLIVWAQSAVILAEGCVIGWLATELFSRLK